MLFVNFPEPPITWILLTWLITPINKILGSDSFRPNFDERIEPILSFAWILELVAENNSFIFE